jgi:hypothetical protein
VERTFAHCYETGAMRRTHLRGHINILKRLLIHVCGFNLGLILRKLIGSGTPKGLAERLKSLVLAVFAIVRDWDAPYDDLNSGWITMPQSHSGYFQLRQAG